MQIVVDIKNESLTNKVIKLLEIFKSDGVEITEILKSKKDEEWSDKYLEKNWREIGMNTHSTDLDDDERLYEAAAKFYNEKYSD